MLRPKEVPGNKGRATIKAEGNPSYITPESNSPVMMSDSGKIEHGMNP